MERVIILGSASAVPDPKHENTHLLVQTSERVVLIDCPGNPIVRLDQAGIEMNMITDIILTHFHPDHVSGFAPLLMSMWLVGRKKPLRVHGLESTMSRAKKMMQLYDWEEWPGFYPVEFVTVVKEERAVLLNGSDLHIYASPVEHLIPTLGLRFEFTRIGRSVVYSCDTEPSQVVLRLAEKADVLIHEATGPTKGHTTAEQAGEIARKTGAGALYLIHYPPQLVDPEHLLEQAKKTFQGPVYVAKDLESILFE